jgi:hypothetical protein
LYRLYRDWPYRIRAMRLRSTAYLRVNTNSPRMQ